MGTELERSKEDNSHEITQRELRKLNIILFNMPEGNSDDSENRKQHNHESFTQICEELKIKNIEVTGVTRRQN